MQVPQAKFFDAHTHIHFPAYDADREEVFARAKNAGVKMIAVGTQESTSCGAVEFAKAHKGDAWATVGFHPAHFSLDWYHDKNEQPQAQREELDIEELKKLAGEPEVVAIGECGLDYFRLKIKNEKLKVEEVSRQKEAFVAQIQLAAEIKKPLMIHCRGSTGSPQSNAFSDLIDILHTTNYLLPTSPGIVHFFTGTKDDAKKLLNLGFAFTFGGVITFSRDYDEIIKTTPLDRILSETDAPYVAPMPYRGGRNEPAYVVEVVKKLAEIKNVSLEIMTEQIRTNARTIFQI